MCSKRRYGSRKEAAARLRDIQANNVAIRALGARTSRRERRFYRCDWCDGYHLTSKAPRR
jgi:hypothetical protein